MHTDYKSLSQIKYGASALVPHDEKARFHEVDGPAWHRRRQVPTTLSGQTGQDNHHRGTLNLSFIY